MADLPFGDVDSGRNGWSGEPSGHVAARRPERAAECQDDHDEDRTGHDARQLRRAGEGVAELENDDRAEQAAPERPDAAEDRDEHGLTRRGPVQQIERGEAVAEREEAAGQSGEAARQHEGKELVAPSGVTQSLRARLVVPDRHEHVPERRMDNAVGDRVADQDQRQRRVVEVSGAAQRETRERSRHTVKPVLPAGEVTPLVGQVEDELREGERDHREVDPAASGREIPERDRKQGGRSGANERGDHEGNAQRFRDDRGGVRAEAPERRVAEREETDVAEEKVDRHREETPQQNVEGEHGVHHSRKRERDSEPDDVGKNGQRASHVRASSDPKRPAGRTSSTIAISANATTFSSAGLKKAARLASTPTRNPATTAPAIEPIPPMTTTANAKMMSSLPISGETLRIGAARTPPSAASMTPKPNTGVTQRSTLIPSARVSSGRSVAARTIIPSRVRSMTYQTATQTTIENPITKSRYVGYATRPADTEPASSAGAGYGGPCRPYRSRTPSWIISVSPNVSRKL